jgi:hypothetical protein
MWPVYDQGGYIGVWSGKGTLEVGCPIWVAGQQYVVDIIRETDDRYIVVK